MPSATPWGCGPGWPKHRWLDVPTRQQGARAAGFMALLKERLVVLDGAMGKMIQGHALTEEHFGGEGFAACPSDLRGNNDLLTITQRTSSPASTASTCSQAR